MGKRANRKKHDVSATTRLASALTATKAAPLEVPVEPTPEQQGRVEFMKQPHTDEMGAKVGFGYRRKPLFETMAKAANAITADELEALRFYRRAQDRCERSATRSCLNVSLGGGGRGDQEVQLETMTDAHRAAKARVHLCEATLGTSLATMRAVALEDRSFSEIAIARYGGRKQDWIVDEEPMVLSGRVVKVEGATIRRKVTREKIVPRSGRHREIIRQEFIAGMRLLTAQLRTVALRVGTEEVWVEPLERGGAFIRRGLGAPNGLFRMWGAAATVDALMSSLRDLFGEELRFPTPKEARTSLEAANDMIGGGLIRLTDDELAA